jgi:hypothetical protein
VHMRMPYHSAFERIGCAVTIAGSSFPVCDAGLLATDKEPVTCETDGTVPCSGPSCPKALA